MVAGSLPLLIISAFTSRVLIFPQLNVSFFNLSHTKLSGEYDTIFIGTKQGGNMPFLLIISNWNIPHNLENPVLVVQNDHR